MDLESFQFDDEEIHTNLMSVEPPPAPAAEEIGNSFTALLDLPPNEAVKLLHSPEKSTPEVFASVFPVTKTENPPETTTNSFDLVKQEPVESDSMRNSSPIFSDLIVSKSTKRKDQEKKVKSLSAKKMKSFATEIDDGEKLPYVHVRARRGEATDSHSLAERARREKINTRMKLLQELVPGCNKIAGTAMVLDEIINHVQSLQLQVELLSMKLAAAYPTIDINLDSLFPSESGSSMDYNFTGMVSPSWGVDGQENVITQPIWHHDELNTLMTPDNSLLSYDCSGNLASWLTSQLKMEL